MTSRLMETDYDPLKIFLEKYEKGKRAFSFNAKDLSELESWRLGFRRKLRELIGLDFFEYSEISPKTVDRKHYPGYFREKVILRSDPCTLIPVYVLVPDECEGPLPAAVAMHGHGYGKDDLVGIWEDGTDRVNPLSRGYQKDFALELVRRRLIVIVPEQSGFGERRTKEDIAKGSEQSSCKMLSLWALMMGTTAMGRRVWDAMRVIDYAFTRKDIDHSRIGMMGISGGGATTLFTAALDERVRVVVISGYLNTFRNSILAVDHCIDNYVPGMLRYGEMHDIAALIAPRPLLVENGSKDPIFPIEATKYAYEQVRRAYALLNAEDRLDADFFEGRHEISGRKAYEFMVKWLS
ncbi:MAG: alpha/beta hydrolase family protein [Crenarchaeota archaeon]|nr:alpha/beta hydrolase family protein [Thermoproteota archaeon]